MKTKVILVGEAYGEREALFEHGFVGPSGRELARMIGEAGLAQGPNKPYPSELDMINYWKRLRNEDGIVITNVFNFRPQNNEIESLFGTIKEGVSWLPPFKAGKYLLPEHAKHIDLLWELILSTKPNLVIALGNTATWALLAKEKISEIRGSTDLTIKGAVKVLPTYHPAAVLRQWNFRPIMVADLIKARAEAEFPEIRRKERWITVNPTLDEIESWLAVPSSYFGIDVESGRALYTKEEIRRMTPQMAGILSSQISMVGFCRDTQNSLVVPIITRNKPSLNYWPCEHDEVRAWQLIQKGLADPRPKIFQNGLYDLQMFLAHGVKVHNAIEDTMLLHHSLFPELPKKLSFLGSVYADERNWKGMYAGGESLKKDD